ncbi:MGMT family protein [Alteromonas antoniana]|uniref:MGMT family protein n=1 Tax=Alteromonas antoniana TaxID=2803813 RepID=UPI001C439E92|nr:MGMT family protein [Alteromonas antoniana]
MPNYTPCEQICYVLKRVPAGCVVSYGQLADLAGLPGRARLAGRCLKETSQNVPWHRVVRADGKLAFPSGSEAYEDQERRLNREEVVITRGRVHMQTYNWKPDIYTILAELPF